MNKFLVKYDFQTLIDEDKLNQVTDDNDRLLNDAMDASIEKVAGYIRHRYDYDQVFKVVQPYAAGTAFVEDDRVFWDATAWDADTVYTSGDIVSIDTGTESNEDEKIYQANDTTVAGESPLTTPAKWDLLADNNTFYTCIANSTGNLPTNETYFTAGDDRNPLIKEITCDIVLYNIHSKVSPRNIPDVRRVRYDGAGNLKEGDSAIATLMQIQKGIVTLDLPVITPTAQKNESIAYGVQSNIDYNY